MIGGILVDLYFAFAVGAIDKVVPEAWIDSSLIGASICSGYTTILSH